MVDNVEQVQILRMLLLDALVQKCPLLEAFETNLIEVVTETIKLKLHERLKVHILFVQLVHSLLQSGAYFLNLLADDVVLGFNTKLMILLLNAIYHVFLYMQPILVIRKVDCGFDFL